jgi:hypothetical protein
MMHFPRGQSEKSTYQPRQKTKRQKGKKEIGKEEPSKKEGNCARFIYANSI